MAAGAGNERLAAAPLPAATTAAGTGAGLPASTVRTGVCWVTAGAGSEGLAAVPLPAAPSAAGTGAGQLAGAVLAAERAAMCAARLAGALQAFLCSGGPMHCVTGWAEGSMLCCAGWLVDCCAAACSAARRLPSTFFASVRRTHTHTHTQKHTQQCNVVPENKHKATLDRTKAVELD